MNSSRLGYLFRTIDHFPAVCPDNSKENTLSSPPPPRSSMALDSYQDVQKGINTWIVFILNPWCKSSPESNMSLFNHFSAISKYYFFKASNLGELPFPRGIAKAHGCERLTSEQIIRLFCLDKREIGWHARYCFMCKIPPLLRMWQQHPLVQGSSCVRGQTFLVACGKWHMTSVAATDTRNCSWSSPNPQWCFAGLRRGKPFFCEQTSIHPHCLPNTEYFMSTFRSGIKRMGTSLLRCFWFFINTWSTK